MNCTVCGRNLNEDSKYCDFCGTKISEAIKSEIEPKILDIKLLFKWIFISLFITIVIALITKGLGVPILFGGLFLPFFFKKKFKK